MNKYMKAVFAAPVLAVMICAQCAADPWAREDDHFRVAFTSAWTVSSAVYDNGRSERSLPANIKRMDVLVYYDEGFSNNTQLSIEAGYTRAYTGATQAGVYGSGNSGASDVWIRHKWQFHEESMDAALLTGVKIPGSYDRHVLNRSGEAQADIELGLSAGQKVAHNGAYWNVDAIHRWRMGHAPNQAEFRASVGRVFGAWNARITWQKLESLGGYGLEETAWGGGAQRFTGVEADSDTGILDLEYRFSPSRALALGYADTLAGGNVLDARAWRLSYLLDH
jgi:hypothetical protein